MSGFIFKNYLTGTAPPTPTTGYVHFFAVDGLLYFVDDAGVIHEVITTGPGTGDLLSTGTVPLTANWDVGAFKITAAQLESDVATGTAPFIVASETVVANLNASLLEGNAAADFAPVVHDHEIDDLLATGITAGYVPVAQGDDSVAWSPPSGMGDLKADGTVPLTANWDVGAFKITAETFESDVATGTAPFTVASTTVVANLNASALEGNAAADFATAAQGGLADTALQSETSHADVLVDGDFGTSGLMKTDGAGTYSIVTDASANWNTAYGWGNHASGGYLTSETSHADVLVDGDFGTAGLMTTDGAGAYSITATATFAAASHNHSWSEITSGTPTTMSGYGISDTKANFNTACSDGTFLFVGDVSSGAFTATSTKITPTTPISLTAASGTEKGLTVSGTVNQSGTASYNMLSIDVTETATGSGSKLPFNINVGGVSRFNVDNAGNIASNVTATTWNWLATQGVRTFGLKFSASGRSTILHAFDTDCVMACNLTPFSRVKAPFAILNNVTDSASSNGVILNQDAFTILAQRNSTNAQTYRIYNTYTDASNYERLSIKGDGKIEHEAAGTGTVSAINIHNKAFTVATLPSGTVGMTARITDGDSGLAWGATAVNSGAGATPYLVWYNGTNWTVMGK